MAPCLQGRTRKTKTLAAHKRGESMDKNKKLQELNKLFSDTNDGKVNHSDVMLYFDLVRELVAEQMRLIVISGQGERQKLLQSIYPMQYSLMKLDIVFNQEIPDDLLHPIRISPDGRVGTVLRDRH